MARLMFSFSYADGIEVPDEELDEDDNPTNPEYSDLEALAEAYGFDFDDQEGNYDCECWVDRD